MKHKDLIGVFNYPRFLKMNNANSYHSTGLFRCFNIKPLKYNVTSFGFNFYCITGALLLMQTRLKNALFVNLTSDTFNV